MRKAKSGFTLVELLVVIVVIAILAAIVLVVYNGIQDRAQNDARVAAASQVVKTLQVYAAENGSANAIMNAIPVGNNDAVCYGKDLPDINGDGLGDCIYQGTTVEASSSPAVDAMLNTTGAYGRNYYPPVSYPGSPSATFAAPMIGNMSDATIDGITGGLVLIYMLNGNSQDCGLSGILTFVSDNKFSSQNARFSMTGSGATWCYVNLLSISGAD